MFSRISLVKSTEPPRLEVWCQSPGGEGSRAMGILQPSPPWHWCLPSGPPGNRGLAYTQPCPRCLPHGELHRQGSPQEAHCSGQSLRGALPSRWHPCHLRELALSRGGAGSESVPRSSVRYCLQLFAGVTSHPTSGCLVGVSAPPHRGGSRGGRVPGPLLPTQETQRSFKLVAAARHWGSKSAERDLYTHVCVCVCVSAFQM